MRFLRTWIPLAVAITGLCGLVYVGGQQTFRQNLNDPQIQMAEDGAAKLAAGGVPADLVPPQRQPRVNIATSLAPWIAVYDENMTPLESSAVLDGKPPQPPAGVFSAAKNGTAIIEGHHLTLGTPKNEDYVTWQPEPGVRQALVVVYFVNPSGAAHGSIGSGYVAAGRNMREIEGRIIDFGYKVLLAWLVTLAATLLAVYATNKR